MAVQDSSDESILYIISELNLYQKLLYDIEEMYYLFPDSKKEEILSVIDEITNSQRMSM